MKHSVVSILILLCFAIASVFAQSVNPESAKRQERAVLNALPESVVNAEIRLLGDRRMTIQEFAGKPIVLNLFATWCGPCRFESPALAQLHKEFSERGLVVIELSTEDPAVTKETLREWVWEFRLPYKVGWIDRELALTLMQERQSIPQTFFITRDGKMLKRFIGYSQENSPKLMREAVEELLK